MKDADRECESIGEHVRAQESMGEHRVGWSGIAHDSIAERRRA